MRRRIETHKPGKVTKVLHVPEVIVEEAEIEIGAGQHHASKIRIVNFLRDRSGNGVRLNEGEDVDVVIRSDDGEAD